MEPESEIALTVGQLRALLGGVRDDLTLAVIYDGMLCNLAHVIAYPEMVLFAQERDRHNLSDYAEEWAAEESRIVDGMVQGIS